MAACLGASLANAAPPPHPLCAAPSGDRGRGDLISRDICEIIETTGPDGRPRRLLPLAGTSRDWAPEALAKADFLLLGEVHDNPIHHRSQARIIARLNSRFGWRQRDQRGPVLSVVMEHIRADQQPALDELARAARQAGRRPTPADVFKALDWAKSGWPAQGMFEPVMDAILDGGIPLLAGDPGRTIVRKVAREGLSTLASGETSRLGLDIPLAAPLQAALLDELSASHCGLMPKAAFVGLADAQRYRDARLARATVDAARLHGHTILLAGNGHVRSDRGVPWYLHRFTPGKVVTSVLHVEVDPRRTRFEDYVERGPNGNPVADYVVLTAAIDRPDPCVAMRKQFKR